MAASGAPARRAARVPRPAVAALLLAALLGAASRCEGKKTTAAYGTPPNRPGKDVFATAANLTKYMLEDPLALCNDNSQAGFYFAPASDLRSENSWLVYLEGGQWCYDKASCEARVAAAPGSISSHGWPDNIFLEGIFDTDPKRSPWAHANKVYVGYCSSDAYVGNSGFNANPVGWSFRGQRIVTAVIERLVTDFALGNSTAPTKMLLAGCSAGARGAMYNLDYVSTILPPTVQLRGFFDSALWTDIEPYEPDVLPLMNQTEQAFVMLNATERVGSVCGAQYPGVDAWKCLVGQWRLPTLKTTWLSSDSQFDSMLLPYDIGARPPYAGAALTYANMFQRSVRSTLMQLPAATQGGSAVFSSACYAHCTSSTNEFWGIHVDGSYSLRDYLSQWFFGGPLGNRPQLVEACVGYGCGQCHKATAAPAPPLPPARAGLYIEPSPPPPPVARLTALTRGSAATTAQGNKKGTSMAPKTLLTMVVVAVVATVALVIIAGRATAALVGGTGKERAPLLRSGQRGPRNFSRDSRGAAQPPLAIRVTRVASAGSSVEGADEQA